MRQKMLQHFIVPRRKQLYLIGEPKLYERTKAQILQYIPRLKLLKVKPQSFKYRESTPLEVRQAYSASVSDNLYAWKYAKSCG